MEHKLRYRLIEQEASLGGAVFHYPRHKVTMTAPVTLALVGKVRFAEVRKEKLLEFWQGVVERTGPVGHAVIYRRGDEGIGRRTVFDSTPPVLAGFEPRSSFAL